MWEKLSHNFTPNIFKVAENFLKFRDITFDGINKMCIRDRRKLSVSVHFWRTKGGCLSDSTIQKLIDAKVPIIVMDNSNYKTYKKPVRMEYQDCLLYTSRCV